MCSVKVHVEVGRTARDGGVRKMYAINVTEFFLGGGFKPQT